MESNRQSEIPRLKQIPRDGSEDSRVLNTDARRSELKWDGEKSKDTEKEESGRMSADFRVMEVKKWRALRWRE